VQGSEVTELQVQSSQKLQIHRVHKCRILSHRSASARRTELQVQVQVQKCKCRVQNYKCKNYRKLQGHRIQVQIQVTEYRITSAECKKCK
jgi:hypothetical protein